MLAELYLRRNRGSATREGLTVYKIGWLPYASVASLNAEEMRPDYKDAVETDNAAIRRGDYNFPGMGLRRNDA